MWTRTATAQDAAPEHGTCVRSATMPRCCCCAAALERDLPLLGVCRGLQLMAVQHGGALHQHLPDVLGHDGHRPTSGPRYGEHPVRLAARHAVPQDPRRSVRHVTPSTIRASPIRAGSRRPGGRPATSCSRRPRTQTRRVRDRGAVAPRGHRRTTASSRRWSRRPGTRAARNEVASNQGRRWRRRTRGCGQGHGPGAPPLMARSLYGEGLRGDRRPASATSSMAQPVFFVATAPAGTDGTSTSRPRACAACSRCSASTRWRTSTTPAAAPRRSRTCATTAGSR